MIVYDFFANVNISANYKYLNSGFSHALKEEFSFNNN